MFWFRFSVSAKTKLFQCIPSINANCGKQQKNRLEALSIVTMHRFSCCSHCNQYFAFCKPQQCTNVALLSWKNIKRVQIRQ